VAVDARSPDVSNLARVAETDPAMLRAPAARVAVPDLPIP
jgi:hypothetical protein